MNTHSIIAIGTKTHDETNTYDCQSQSSNNINIFQIYRNFVGTLIIRIFAIRFLSNLLAMKFTPTTVHHIKYRKLYIFYT